MERSNIKSSEDWMLLLANMLLAGLLLLIRRSIKLEDFSIPARSAANGQPSHQQERLSKMQIIKKAFLDVTDAVGLA